MPLPLPLARAVRAVRAALVLAQLLVTAAPAAGAVPRPAVARAAADAVAVVRPAVTAEPLTTSVTSPWSPPVSGRIAVLRPFAVGPHRWSPSHRGVDLALPTGGTVTAAGPGVVVFAGPVAGRGVVSVSHGALRTTYEPVVPAVRVGERVAAGTPLGVLASGHAPCGECLHWGLRRGEHYYDPLRLLRPARVRLLPLSAPSS